MVNSPILALAPATTRVLGVPGAVLHGILVLIFASLFAWILGRRIQLLLAAQPDARLDRPGERLQRLFRVGFGQSRQPRYPLAGWLHIVVFLGFLVLLFRSLTLLGEGFQAGFHLPGLGGHAGEVYGVIKDATALLVLIAVVVLAIRRLVFRPKRYHDRTSTRSHGHEAYIVLGLIALLLVSDGVYERAGNPSLQLAGFWIHNIALLFFACYLPLSKHFHVITALPNTYFSKLEPLGRVKAADHDVSKLEDFTWKHLLDAYSCTDCGRCSDQCPAYNTGAPLSPRMISIKTRDEAYETWPVFGAMPDRSARPALVGDVITDAEIWACTTCGACEETCPVLIEYVDKIVDMRRHLVEEGRVPKTLQKALADVEKKKNPYGKMPRKRADWTQSEDGEAETAVEVLKKGQTCQDLFFTDSCAAYDPRIQKIARSFARILAKADREVGTLGKDEADSGHEVRRMGEEGLYEVLRDQNEEALSLREFDRVVTTDPHAMNALRCDYDLEKPVEHHTMVLAKLLREGTLRPKALEDGKTYVFHDPCYLGRHTGEYDAPRDALRAIPGLRLEEMDRSRERSFCCGGGSLYLFYEGESERRMGEVRVEMAEAAGADVIVTACPFCLLNLEDAVKTTGRSDKIEVIDLVEVVERALE